jgi:inosose dehydratase
MARKDNRRDFFHLAAGAVTGVAAFTGSANGVQPAGSKSKALVLGMASYTWRKFPLERAIAWTSRIGLDKIAFKSMHLPLDSRPEHIQAAITQVKAVGLDPYACGVIYMKTSAEVQQAFDYAKAAGMKTIIGVPDHELLDEAEARVKEYNIRLAIHNHGPEDKLYPTPGSVYERVKSRDPRMGICLDVGHAQRAAVDPAKASRDCFDRLFDVHIKDVSASTAEGRTVEIGRGVVDIRALLDTFIKLKYSGVLALEYEKDEDDPLAGAAESVGYLKGVLAAL